MSHKTYTERLRDPRWQRKRLEIMERDNFQCRECESKEKTLNVHHRYYTKGAAPWDYPDSALVTLCEDCHKLVEKQTALLLKKIAPPSSLHGRVLRFVDAIEGGGPFVGVSEGANMFAEFLADYESAIYSMLPEIAADDDEWVNMHAAVDRLREDFAKMVMFCGAALLEVEQRAWAQQAG